MRINMIPVELLSDAHLRAEYREILMSAHYYRKSSQSKQGIIRSKISKEYTLNTGHAMFFYNKMDYIIKRHDLLEAEMIKRSFKIRQTYDLKASEYCLPQDINDYIPSQDDILINIERILRRIYEMEFIKNKPGFYKLNGANMSFLDWSVFYTENLKISCSDVHKMITDIEKDLEC